jgi:catechol 2,3-dioxygenase-like lactoylglutathione lyase family enzyme
MLHRLTGITLGVPNVAETAAYYADFGLTGRERPSGDETGALLATVDGGEQLKLVTAGRRRLVQLGVAADDPDDLDRIAAALSRLDLAFRRTGSTLSVVDPGTEVEVVVSVAARIEVAAFEVPRYNAPGNAGRPNSRAPGVQRSSAVRPRKLGHVVIGSTAQQASERFFCEGLGFKVSDRVPGKASFLRCSTDHHNVLVQEAPLTMLHHTSWQVNDVDELGRGASAMLAKDPGRHVWGLGRHHIGSNFFWYLKDPAGNFSEYYADMDCIVDDQLWSPRDWTDYRALYSWGGPPPASFLQPEDLAELMAAAHAGS